MKATSESQLDQCMMKTENLTLQDPLSPASSVANSPASFQQVPSPQQADKPPKLHTCDDCKKTFTSKYFLKKHKRLHTGELRITKWNKPRASLQNSQWLYFAFIHPNKNRRDAIHMRTMWQKLFLSAVISQTFKLSQWWEAVSYTIHMSCNKQWNEKKKDSNSIILHHSSVATSAANVEGTSKSSRHCTIMKGFTGELRWKKNQLLNLSHKRLSSHIECSENICSKFIIYSPLAAALNHLAVKYVENSSVKKVKKTKRVDIKTKLLSFAVFSKLFSHVDMAENLLTYKNILLIRWKMWIIKRNDLNDKTNRTIHSFRLEKGLT